MKPIIKWLGGKTQLLQKIHELMPPGFDSNKNMYYEPFLGGAAVLLDINPTQAIVSDINPELINVYQQIKHNVELVISDLSKFDRCHEGYDNPKGFYYDVRNDFNKYLGDKTSTQAPTALAVSLLIISPVFWIVNTFFENFFNFFLSTDFPDSL